MRKATLLLALFFSAVIALEGCVLILASMGLERSGQEDLGLGQAGGAGVLLAIFYVVGGAFALGAPIAAIGVFVFAAVAIVLVEQDVVWCAVSLAMAGMAYLGHREDQRRNAPPRQPREDDDPYQRPLRHRRARPGVRSR